MNRKALPLPFHLPLSLSLPLSAPIFLSLMAMLGLTSLTASAAGFYRFEQWGAPLWGNPNMTPNTTTYYWYQPQQALPGNYYYWYLPPQPLTGSPTGQTFYWYQFGQPQVPQGLTPGLSPQSLQAPQYWYWFQPYY